MSNEATFVPVGVPAEQAPHVVITRWNTGNSEVLPVVGWFLTENGPEPGVCAGWRGSVMQFAWRSDGPLVLDGYEVWDWSLHATKDEARAQASKHNSKADETRLAFLRRWHERIGPEFVTEVEALKHFKQHELPIELSDFHYVNMHVEIGEDRPWDVLEGWDNEPFEHQFRLESRHIEEGDEVIESKFRVVKTDG
ncbi:hypothetical protein [Streptomyces turgidiscabies]|uniref:hypothetical protein n=1 Tax=Streptomyces turgidiscabies TaxID=85558 RepID=UPI0038F606D8